MTDEPPKQARNHKRLWRWFQLGAWLVFLIWFSRFAYVRVTTPPAALADPAALKNDSVLARLEEICDRAMSLPTPPGYDNSLGTIFYPWGVSALGPSLLGKWAPDLSSNQDLALRYLNKPAVASELDALADLCRQHESRRDNLYFGSLNAVQNHDPGVFSYQSQQAVSALVSRARVRHAADGDVAGALSDLRAATTLEKIFRQLTVGPYYRFGSPILLADFELGCMSMEVDVPPALADEMIRFLNDDDARDLTAATISPEELETRIDKLLDSYYTRDENNEGWFVLSASPDVLTRFLSVASKSRPPIWNIFSRLFSDRQTVREKWLSIFTYNLKSGVENKSPGGRSLPSSMKAMKTASILDGPLLYMLRMEDAKISQSSPRTRTNFQLAAIVMLSLSAYKHDHGEYPSCLKDLAPDYLGQAVLYEVWDAAINYNKLENDRYELNTTSAGAVNNVWFMRQNTYAPPSFIPCRVTPAETNNTKKSSNAEELEENSNP